MMKETTNLAICLPAAGGYFDVRHSLFDIPCSTFDIQDRHSFKGLSSSHLLCRWF